MSDIDYTFVEYENMDFDIYKKIYHISSDLNVFLQFLTVTINFFHLLILLHKELRTGAIYILMIGTCVADFSCFLLDFYNIGYERFWFHIIPFEFNSDCINTKWMVITIGPTVINLIIISTRPVAVWLAVFMAGIRTLSISFPMSLWIQKLTKPRVVVWIVVCSFGFWAIYYSWDMVFLKVVWYPSVLDMNCPTLRYHINKTQYVFVMSQQNHQYEILREAWEPYVRIIPTVFYPILTVALLLQLRFIKKKRQNVQKNSLNDRSDNTTKLILIMTVFFMLSEGLAGINGYWIMRITENLDMNQDDMVDLLSALGTFQFICNNLRTINATSHFFICFMMSSQYRDTVKKMFCIKKKKKGTTVKVSSASVASLQSISGIRN